MDYRKIGVGLGAFAAGSVALLLGRRVKGSFFRLDGEATTPPSGSTGQLPPVPVATEPHPATPTASPSPEHVPTDLAAGRDVRHERAIDAFRPDPTAPVSPELRDSLRPATGPAPSLVGNKGETVTEAVGAG